MASNVSHLAPAKLNDLTGRVAVVTGGATGIGLFQACGLAAAGAKVYLASRRSEVLEQAVKHYGFAGFVECDVTNKESLLNLAKEMDKREGKVDVVVANAGGPGPTHFGADTS